MKNRAAYFGVFTALALILSYVEILIPISFGVPGVKLGLANLIILIVLYKTDWREALLLSVVRIMLAGFIFGNMFSILYSLAGGVLSLAAMALLKRRESFSVVGVSIGGGVSHNIGHALSQSDRCGDLPGGILSSGAADRGSPDRISDRNNIRRSAETDPADRSRDEIRSVQDI